MKVIVWDIVKAQDYQDRRDRKEPEVPPNYLAKEKKGEKKVIEPPVVAFLLLSTMSTSQTSIVSDIHWLPKDFEVNIPVEPVEFININASSGIHILTVNDTKYNPHAVVIAMAFSVSIVYYFRVMI